MLRSLILYAMLCLVVAEILLNFPSLFFSTFQICNEDCVLHFTKDLTIAIPIYAIHRNPEYWEEPETFTLTGNTCNTTTTQHRNNCITLILPICVCLIDTYVIHR